MTVRDYECQYGVLADGLKAVHQDYISRIPYLSIQQLARFRNRHLGVAHHEHLKPHVQRCNTRPPHDVHKAQNTLVFPHLT